MLIETLLNLLYEPRSQKQYRKQNQEHTPTKDKTTYAFV